jgi:hypothetical protein
MPRRRYPLTSRLSDALDADFTFLESEKDPVTEMETDICGVCGAIRKLHEKGVEGSVVDAKRCKGFRWMK